MKKLVCLALLCCCLMTTIFATSYEELTADFTIGKVELQSISTMTFGPEGLLLLGDSKAGVIYALDLKDRTATDYKEALNVEDIESKLGAMLGTDAKGVLIHDMTVNPISKNTYLAVSKADANKLGFWKMPNDIANASILIKITPDGNMEAVSLDVVSHSKAKVMGLIDEGSQNWRKSDKRTEAITDLEYADGKVYVAGLSNEEFASALRVLPFPFKTEGTFNTVEVYHVAHAKSETEAPIRTMLPYTIDGEQQLLAVYTCTPMVSIPIKDLANGQHIKSKTLAELGAGNMPLDMITYVKNGKEYILIANSSKAVLRIDPDKIAMQKEGITTPLEKGSSTAGVPYYALSKIGVMQIDKFDNDHTLLLQRQLNGQLNLVSYPNKWL